MAISKIILNGVTQMDVTQKTVTAGSMLSGTTALKNDGTDITGSIATKTSSDLTANVLTVTAPAGYYASAASKTLSDANLVAGNVKKDVSIFGVTGTYEGGGGGSNWTLLASKEFSANTTSTSQTTIGNIDLDSLPTGDYIIWIHVRDKAGARNGYFYGTDSFFLVFNGARPTNANPPGYTQRYSGSAFSVSSTMRGIYPYQINTSNQVVMYARYASSTSGTINGTYKCDVYKLTFPV